MVKFSVLYGHPKDPAAFEKYYFETHGPIAATIQGVRKVEVSKAAGAPDGSAPAYYRMADLYFDDVDHVKRVLETPEAKATIADLPNFATGGFTMLISEVG